jgi:hypothetical protein
MRSMSPCLAWKKRPPGFARLRPASPGFACFFWFLCFIFADELPLAVRCEHTRKFAVWEEKGTVLGYS